MSRKKKFVEDMIRLIGRELQGSRNREALEETGRRLLARLEGGGEEEPEERRGGGVAWGTRSPLRPVSRGSRIGGAVAFVAGSSGLLALVLLALFAFSVALRMNADYSEWLLPAIALVSLWSALPALWLSVRGAAGLFGARSSLPEAESASEDRKEKELLGALERRGEITPARAAMETSLTVAEADRVLSDFARKGYVAARVSGGSLIYALWDEDRQMSQSGQPEKEKGESRIEEGADDWDPGS